MDLRGFNPVSRRLGAITGLESDHVPIAFTASVGDVSLRVLSWNISNEAAHRWFATEGNAYGETDLVGIPRGKVLRQLWQLGGMLEEHDAASGTSVLLDQQESGGPERSPGYDVVLIQEADAVSVAGCGYDVFSDINRADSPFHGKDWAMSAIMVSGRFLATGGMLSGEYLDDGRKMRTEMPYVDIRPASGGEVIMRLVSAHVRGNDAQNPAAGIRSALELAAGEPVVVAGDFNTVPDLVEFDTWRVANPQYPTHMCRYGGGYCVAAYDNVVSRGVRVEMLPLPAIPSAIRLLDALNAA